MPQELTNAQGQLVWQASYKTWGSTVTEEWQAKTLSGNPIHQLDAGDTPDKADQQQNLRFQGQYLDRETGLHYNTFRYYDPDMGRFICPDPIGLQGGINLGSYSPNPLRWIDPWGLACWGTARKDFWKNEAEVNPGGYSKANLDLMKDGKAPKIEVEVRNRKTGDIETKEVSMELHHRDIPQRDGSAGVHDPKNLDKVTPWEHEARDPYRHTGSDLLRIIKDLGVWGD